jgi:protein-disulfide isomerase
LAADISRRAPRALDLATSLGFVLASLLAGCSGGAPSLTTAGVPAPGEVRGSLSPEEVAQSGPTVAFNPFSDMTQPIGGGREVIATPTLAEVLEPVGLPEISFGRADAPVTIVEYASLTCPYCKAFHGEVYPQLKRAYIDTGKVRFILREFPIGKTSGQANIAARCAKPERYLEVFGKFLAQQPAWVSQEVRLDPIFAVASQVGVTRAEFDACRNDVALVEGLKAVKDRGRKLGVIGTPNFFIDGKLVKSTLTFADIQARIDPVLASRKVAAN